MVFKDKVSGSPRSAAAHGVAEVTLRLLVLRLHLPTEGLQDYSRAGPGLVYKVLGITSQANPSAVSMRKSIPQMESQFGMSWSSDDLE